MNGYECALSLLQTGIQVIPMIEKMPMLKFANVPITEGFINYHASKYKQAQGLAVLCRGVWCVDFDTPKTYSEKHGLEAIKLIPYYDEFVANAKKTWQQTTPSGGSHVIFRKNEGINYSQHIGYLENVDIKAHDNNYFMLDGSKTNNGRYQSNKVAPICYKGDFEKRIFSRSGNYEQQTMDKYSAKNVLKNYDFSYIPSRRTGDGEGKRAYERIINGTSIMRNNDLFKAVSYAKTCKQPIEPLKCVIGTVKNGDEFTAKAWEATVNSALNR
ncbi:bifunctional DNA primase/polymerase [Aerococcus sanguinicola]|uniref:DNA primase n=1 Tax=Aerococcus sanguinicola TaxID=119206 RepID=A0A0X8FBQ4_9LACT|nr:MULTISPECIES: bifunctional DNA primase/polymerase [Aerococcus]AMB94415.1 DNA primase [Aerococcus sanguinicola]MDK7051091.1 bifunctional DNA primase/polymerase [Aerococcus sanguinicola]OFT94085.1 DNA primase [Aerococcus sp. HMSC23C02]PKZ20738.1 DNA primase [Aerococcus sanguinicola]